MMTADRKRLSTLRAAARTPDEILGAADPGVLSGVVSAVPQGVITGVAQVEGAAAGLAARAYQPVLDAVQSVTGVTPWNPFVAARDQADAWAKQYRPDPLSTGMAGQAMFEISRIVTQAGIGAAATVASGGAAAGALAAGAATAGAASGRSKYLEMVEQGVDPNTAANIGYTEALTIGAGVLMPGAIGYNSLAAPFAAGGVGLSKGAYYGANVAYGAGANIGMGIAQRGAAYQLLKSGGYETMAEQYQPLEAAALTAEGLLGAGFAALGARGGLASGAQQPAIDAALVARAAKHAAIDTAPGVPADPAAANAHDKGMQTAMRQVLAGEPVDVSQAGLDDAVFVPRPRDSGAQDAALAEYGLELPPAARYAPGDRLAALPVSDRSQLRYDAPELNEYAALVEERHGLPAGLINALKNAGERSNSNQTSPAGARGVMQFMPENLEKYGVTDPTDPLQMLDAAGRYLSDTKRQYGGNVDAMIADYNGGPRQARWVMRGQEPAAKETRDYLARVKEWMGDSGWRASKAVDDSRPPAGRGRLIDDSGEAAPLIEPVRITLPEFATGPMADSLPKIREFARENFAGKTVVNEADGSEISIPWQGIKHSLSGTVSRAVAAAALRIEDVIRKAEPVWSGPDRAGRQNVKAAHFYDAPIEVDGMPAEIRVVVRESNTGKRYYDHFELRKNESPAPGDQRSIQEGSGASVLQSSEANVAQSGAEGNSGALRGAGEPTAVRPLVERGQAGEAAAPSDAVDGGGQPGQGGAGQRAIALADDAETQAGLALLDEKGDLVVPIETADGEVVNLSLRAALAEADAELKYAKADTLKAAVTCFLTKGM